MSRSVQGNHGMHREPLSAWLTHGAGARMLHAEVDHVNALIAVTDGNYTLQMGHFGRALRLPPSGTCYRAVLEPETPAALLTLPESGDSNGMPLAITDPLALPISSSTIDLVLLPHILECINQPLSLLREIERILTDDGYMIICGFTPFSLFVLWRWWQRLRPTAPLPQQARFVSLHRLQQWLSSAGFKCVSIRRCCYRPPLASRAAFEQLRWLEHYAQRLQCPGAAVYCVLAHKRSLPLSPFLRRQRNKHHDLDLATAAGRCPASPH